MRRDDDHTPTWTEIGIALLLAVVGSAGLMLLGYVVLVILGMW